MEKESLYNLESESLLFLPESRALLMTTQGEPFGKPAAKPTSPLLRQYGPHNFLYWGNGNDYPQQVVATANQSPELLSLIDFLCTVLYGGGLIYETYELNSKGDHTWKRFYDPEVEEWMQYNYIQDYLLESIVDFTWFNHGFPELIKNKRGDKIVQVTHQEASFCRFGLQNPKNGFNDKVFINANWPMGQPGDEWTSQIDAIDPYNITKIDYAKAGSFKKFIYPINYPAPGKIVYQLANWHSLFSSSWLDLSIDIPVLKKMLMKYQMTIKYLIKVPQSFWEARATEQGKTWKTLTPEERKSVMTTTRTEIDAYLTGSKNAGKSFITTFGWDPINKSEIPGISISALDDKLKDGKYIEDSKEASGQMIRALGIPAPLIGPISSGDMGGGSGSDARIHFNILNKRLKSRKDKILAPLNFIAQYNGWTQRMPGFRFAIEEFVIDTLDVSHSTTNPAPKSDGQPAQ